MEDFPYFPYVKNPESWMHDNLNAIGDKFLWQISLPGSHDSGMSSSHNGTFGAKDCTTKTQSKNIFEQLEAGVRYFDIRPIIGGGKFYTGHYTGNKGARGGSMQSIIDGVNKFTKNQSELIILSLSHAYDTDQDDYSDFTEGQWKSLLNKMTRETNYLSVKNKDLISGIKMKEYIQNGSTVLIIAPTESNYISGKGVYFDNDLDVYDKYSDTNDVNKMKTDQLRKMSENPPNSSELFLLSWTLTQDAEQAVKCNLGLGSSIGNLAAEANSKLYDVIKAITSDHFPNIVSVDYFPSNALSVAMYANTKE